MKLGIDFNEGDELWCCDLLFAGYGKSKVRKRIVPTKCKILRSKTCPTDCVVVDITSGNILNVGSFNGRISIEDKCDYFLFHTEDECRQYWSSRVLNKLDELNYIHQENLKYLNKYLEKGKSKGN